MGAETAFVEPLGSVPGMASMRPRHDGRGNDVSGSSHEPKSSRFNEAAPRWARKRGRSRGVHGGASVASMRPRHDGRGNTDTTDGTQDFIHELQ